MVAFIIVCVVILGIYIWRAIDEGFWSFGEGFFVVSRRNWRMVYCLFSTVFLYHIVLLVVSHQKTKLMRLQK